MRIEYIYFLVLVLLNSDLFSLSLFLDIYAGNVRLYRFRIDHEYVTLRASLVLAVRNRFGSALLFVKVNVGNVFFRFFRFE